MLEVLSMENKNKNNKKVKNEDIVESIINVWAINSTQNPIDVLGSYTGTPYSAYDDRPEQDPDDL